MGSFGNIKREVIELAPTDYGIQIYLQISCTILPTHVLYNLRSSAYSRVFEIHTKFVMSLIKSIESSIQNVPLVGHPTDVCMRLIEHQKTGHIASNWKSKIRKSQSAHERTRKNLIRLFPQKCVMVKFIKRF